MKRALTSAGSACAHAKQREVSPEHQRDRAEQRAASKRDGQTRLDLGRPQYPTSRRAPHLTGLRPRVVALANPPKKQR
jgi:hypothetical protein